ncbi:MAG: TonB-dependent receptor [Tannerellaceae bacterium]|jgi:hypothetical protein|nr:TonB-dependent receptor [Tannerellaceae bacterium]
MNHSPILWSLAVLLSAPAFASVRDSTATILGSDTTFALGEVTVVAKAPEVSVRNDTMVYNADSYKVGEGQVLEDLLKKMPGVEVSDEGTITVNGKTVKRIMVDGKEFFSADPKVASKNLPSNMVDKVQVLDKLSDMSRMTGFNDGDEETVINLTVKPGMKQGWFGNAFAGYGSQQRYEGNGMVNRFTDANQLTLMGGFNNTNNMGFSDLASTMFQGMGEGRRRMWQGGGNGITQSANIGSNINRVVRPDQLEINGNARYAYSDNRLHGRTSRQNILTTDSSSYEAETDTSTSISENIGANLRIDWHPNEATQLVFRPDFGYSRTRKSEHGQTYTLDGIDGIGDTVNSGRQHSTQSGQGYNASLQIDFSRKLNLQGRVLSGSLQAGINDSYSDGINYSDITYTHAPNTHLNQFIRYDNSSYNYRAFFSFVEPVGGNYFLQATYTYRFQQQQSLKNVHVLDTSTDSSSSTHYLNSFTTHYLNSFTTQRFSLGFKAVREKYNYTLGFNLDPTSTSSVTDSLTQNRPQDGVTTSLTAVNFSPMAEFRYNFGRNRSLRIDYNGITSQPSLAQMNSVPDDTDPTNIKYGNPDLKPRYAHNLQLRLHSFTQETQFAYFLMADANYVLNEVVSYVKYLNNFTGNRTTHYLNVDGNYSANLRFMINSPLPNRKFTIHNASWISYTRSTSFLGDDTIPNESANVQLMQRLGLDYRSTSFDLGLHGNVRYNGVTYSLQKNNDQQVFNYSLGGRTTIYLPWDIKLESDLTWSTNSGYTDLYKLNELLWNASASKSFLKGNAATLRLKLYDILQQRSNITRSVTASYIQDAQYNALSSYFICHFIYRFGAFKKNFLPLR